VTKTRHGLQGGPRNTRIPEMAHPRLNGSLALAFVRVIRDIRAVFLLFAVAQQLRSLVAQLVVRCALCPVPCTLAYPPPSPFCAKSAIQRTYSDEIRHFRFLIRKMCRIDHARYATSCGLLSNFLHSAPLPTPPEAHRMPPEAHRIRSQRRVLAADISDFPPRLRDSGALPDLK